MVFVARLDWGGTVHAICTIDKQSGAVAERFKVRHDVTRLREFLSRLTPGGLPLSPLVAIERPTGLIVDVLVETGHPVISIHSNAVKAPRPHYCASCAKDDRGDAYLLTDLLRTDGHRFHPLVPAPDAIRRLRGLTRGGDDLVAIRIALANLLRNLLESFWPDAAVIYTNIDSPIALAFLARYLTPQSAAQLAENRLAALLAAHAYCGRRGPAELPARPRAAPTGFVGEAEADAKNELVSALVAVLPPLVARIAELSARIRHAVAELPDGRLPKSFPRSGPISAAEAGVKPVTRQSGRSPGASLRWACNSRLRAALTCFADKSRHASQWAAATYGRAFARGCRHPHASRVLGRAWTGVLWRAWQDRHPYDPANHTAVVAMG